MAGGDGNSAPKSTGQPVYDDHWSPDGHEVIAKFLTDNLCAQLPELNCERELSENGR